MEQGRIVRVAGSIVVAEGLRGAALYHRVGVGPLALPGEVIRIEGEWVTVQVYEETEGLRIGEPVLDTGQPFSVILGPGLLGSVVDGVQRPLPRLLEAQGPFLHKTASGEGPGDPRAWAVRATVAPGEAVSAGTVVAEIEETPALTHRVLCPPNCSGTVSQVFEGERRLGDPACELEGGVTVTLSHAWPCRIPRPVARRLDPRVPAVTGQRVIDAFFPLAEGGIAVVPGGFGTGKTVLEHILARHLEADVVVYVGCGERGNEMTDILEGFAALEDPRTGRPLLERTVLVANTSNMPVAAREASIYTGVTIAEYYRDMGYRVALLADSVSRWAEALREISSRLEEMPGEEGYPPYLASRLGQFYERAGRVVCLGHEREGALSMVAAISPPGGDFSEPVTQASMRVAGCFWALDPSLAAQRHYPAIDWTESYSLYRKPLRDPWEDLGGEGWAARVRQFQATLAREAEVREIAQLVGYDALQVTEQLALEAGACVRDAFLRQDAASSEDAASSPRKTRLLMEIIGTLLERAKERVGERGIVALEELGARGLSSLRQREEARLEEVLEEVRQGGGCHG